MEVYSYAPLGPGEIRLVSLSITAGDKLHASMKQVLFDEKDPIKFCAISYVWGDKSNTTEVVVNSDKTLQITKSLEGGLRQLIKTPSEDFVWIDQICINQKDDAEKSSQVRRMDKIFNCEPNI